MYLWCNNCHHAHHSDTWRRITGKYGVCPRCGVSEYRNAILWIYIARVNGYPEEPAKGVSYPPYPMLF